MLHPPPLRSRVPALGRGSVAWAAAVGAALVCGTFASAPARAASRPGGAWPSSAPAAIAAPDAPAYEPHVVIVGYAPRTMATVAAQVRFQTRARAQPAPSPHSQLLRLPTGESVMGAIARLRRHPGVAYAEPDYIAHAAGGWYPDDPGRAHQPQGWQSTQWNLLPQTGVDAPDAWLNLLIDHRGGGKGVRVAIIDTGVAYRDWHQFRRMPDFGRTRFVAPYDFVADNRYPLDRNGHGTFVAAEVAESTNNGIGLTGLAYGASIMPIRVLDGSGLGDEATIAKGIRYAVRHGAQIINLSLEFLPNQVASGSAIPEIVSALDYAHRRGVTVVAAAGNDAGSQIAYPAKLPTVISVGATTKDGCLADYSNAGTGLDLVAPGGGDDAVLSGDPNCNPGLTLPPIYQMTLDDPPHWGRFGYPGFYIGTSMASPEVAATAALVIASGVLGPNPTPDAILARLEATATPLGSGLPNTEYGYGLLDAGRATSPAPPTSGVPPAGTPPSSGPP